MINLKLGVEVASARDLMPKDGQGTASPFVELHFDHQKFQTTTKDIDLNPVWDETFYFNISDPNHLRHLTLEAYVYHHKKPNSKSFLGKVVLPGTSFAPYSDAVVLHYPLAKRRNILSRVKGELGLKVFVTDDHHIPNPTQAQAEPSVNHEVKSVPHEPPKVVPNNTGSLSRLPPSVYMLKEITHSLGGGRIVGGQFVRGDRPVTSGYELVETMNYVFVRVVKAVDLSCLDTYVEVKIGYYKGITRLLEKNHNPEWNQVFAFPRDNLQSSAVDVVVKDKGLVTDDIVGFVRFDLDEVPTRVQPDSSLASKWHQIVDKDGAKKKGELMLSVWYGTQADKAFPNAFYSDVILPAGVSSAAYAHARSKVYYSPRLWHVRVTVIEAQDLVVSEESRIPEAYAKVQIGNQCLKTKTVQSLKPTWNEELIFVAAEPYGYGEDQYLIISVEDRVGPDKDEAFGRVSIPWNSVERRAESTNGDRIIRGQWFNLDMSMSNSMEKDKDDKFASKIHLHVCLDGEYHLLDESTNYCSDLHDQSEATQLWKPVGVLELGVLGAIQLEPMEIENGKATTNPYCVAKYGNKWVRTRTITDSLNPEYNQQYRWEVYDPVSILTVGVFDNRQIGNSNGLTKDKEIGKVQIRISTIESDHVYTLSFPLLSLCPSGIKKMGELQLAIRFSCTSLFNLMLVYSQPPFPKMHSARPLPEMQKQAVLMVADRLGQAEPPLGKEVVQYMYSDANFDIWSMRRSKANFFRLMSVLSGSIGVLKWVGEVCMWKNPIMTVLVHVLFVMLVCTPELIFSTVFLYLFVIGIWQYGYRPRYPPHIDTRLSLADSAHPDELDEEFDTFPTSRSLDIVQMRYDRLRSVAGRIQTMVGDGATQGERILALINWRDPRATVIFLTFCLFAAIVLIVTPLKVVVILAGFYFMRHPMFRRRLTPAPLTNFFRRLPSRSDGIL